MHDISLFFIPLLLSLGFTIVLFLILREVVLWYWKVNERLKVMKSVDEKLTLLEKRLASLDEKIPVILSERGNVRKEMLRNISKR